MKNRTHGLSQTTVDKLNSLFSKYPEIKSFRLFGSRALGTFKEGSDIDIAVFGLNITHQTLRSLSIAYEELNLPYQLDLIHYEAISNADLKTHIDLHGITLS